MTAIDRLIFMLYDLIADHHASHRTDLAWSICPDELCQATAYAVGLR